MRRVKSKKNTWRYNAIFILFCAFQVLFCGCGDKAEENPIVSKHGLVAVLRIVKPPSTVDSVMLEIEVENTSEKPVRILKWDSPLEGAVANDIIYEVLDSKNRALLYKGILAKRPKPTEADYCTLQPRARVKGAVNLACCYTFKAGESYRIRYGANYMGDVPQTNWVEVKITD